MAKEMALRFLAPYEIDIIYGRIKYGKVNVSVVY